MIPTIAPKQKFSKSLQTPSQIRQCARICLACPLPEKGISAQKVDNEKDHRLVEEIQEERMASQEGERNPRGPGDTGGGESPFAPGIDPLPRTEPHQHDTQPGEQRIVIKR